MAASHGADLERVNAGYLASHGDRDAEGAKGYRGGVGDQAQAGGVQRVEPQADQQGSSNGHRGAETSSAFEKGTKGEANQEHLQALVIGNRQHRAADHFKLTTLDRQFVEEDRGNNDPGDGPQAIREAIAGGGEGHVSGHLEGEDGHGDGQCQGDAASHVALEAEHRQGEEEEHDRNQCRHCRPAKAAEWGVKLLPGLHDGVAPNCCWSAWAKTWRQLAGLQTFSWLNW